ncbi:MAG: pyridoxal-phosphate dependent enzyme, partial [Ferruginibacter sp.]
SGNKLFKLHYFLQSAINEHKAIITFGGAYSNHLVATAYTCAKNKIRSIGIVRGELPGIRSHTLLACEKYGMELHFISRDEYTHNKEKILGQLKNNLGECIIIPEGGYNLDGALGASLIMNGIKGKNISHVCSAFGTGTTIAGLLMNSSEIIIGIPVLKNLLDVEDRIKYLGAGQHMERLIIFNEYHFGGYAKKDNGLITFMNELYINFKLPTDFIYTGKMFYAVFDKIRKGFFQEGSRIMCLHTGGLQGNYSLEPGMLIF